MPTTPSVGCLSLAYRSDPLVSTRPNHTSCSMGRLRRSVDAEAGCHITAHVDADIFLFGVVAHASFGVAAVPARPMQEIGRKGRVH